MQAAENMAEVRELPWLGLGVGVENPGAAALYVRLGYTRTGIVTHSEYDYVDENGVAQHAVEWDEYMIKKSSGDDLLAQLRPAGRAAE